MIDRELPVMAGIALAVGLALAVGINSFAGSDDSNGVTLRTAEDHPSVNVAALRGSAPSHPRPARRRARGAKPAQPARAAGKQPTAAARPATTFAAPDTGRTVPTKPVSSPAPEATARPAPAPKPSPAPKPQPKPGGGGAQPFDDSG